MNWPFINEAEIPEWLALLNDPTRRTEFLTYLQSPRPRPQLQIVAGIDPAPYQYIIDKWRSGDREQASIDASTVVYADGTSNEPLRTMFAMYANGIERTIVPEKRGPLADGRGKIHDKPIITDRARAPSTDDKRKNRRPR